MSGTKVISSSFLHNTYEENSEFGRCKPFGLIFFMKLKDKKLEFFNYPHSILKEKNRYVRDKT